MPTREELERRWQEVADELQQITSTRLIPDQAFPEEREEELLAEQDRIEWELGEMLWPA